MLLPAQVSRDGETRHDGKASGEGWKSGCNGADFNYYASQFSTTELNGVFYRTPPPETVRNWRDECRRMMRGRAGVTPLVPLMGLSRSSQNSISGKTMRLGLVRSIPNSTASRSLRRSGRFLVAWLRLCRLLARNLMSTGDLISTYARSGAIRIQTYRDENRARHFDLVSAGERPRTVDLVLLFSSGMLVFGGTCALLLPFASTASGLYQWFH